MDTIPYSKIIGHAHILRFLGNTARSGCPSHAYLFYGPEGVGKKSIAKRFAMALLCEQPSMEGDACESCESCRRFQADANQNFQLIEPEGKVNYKIDQIRELRKNVSFTAFSGGKRVYLILNVDMMKPADANALLKTLEEPNPGIIFILVTQHILKILPTTISRCHQVPFNRIPTAEIMNYIKQEEVAEPQKALLLATLAFGSIGKLREYSQGPLADTRQAILTNISGYTPAEFRKAFALAESILQSKKNAEEELDEKLEMNVIYDWLISWFRDLLVYRLTKDPTLLINIDFQTELAALSTKWNWVNLRLTLQQLEYLKWLSAKNLNAQFCLETVFLRSSQSLT